MSNVIQFTPPSKNLATKSTVHSITDVHYMRTEYVLQAAYKYSHRASDYTKMHELLKACMNTDEETLICELNEIQWALYLEA